MSPTPPNSPLQSRRIQVRSPFLHARLPQMFPLVQYSYRSLPFDLSALETRTSHTQMSPLPVSSTTLTRRTLHPPYEKFEVLVPYFKDMPEHHLCQSHSLTTQLPILPSSKPSPEFATTSTMATRTSCKLKRSFKLLAPSDTEGRPAKMMKRQLSLCNSTQSDDWNLSQIPLHHCLPLTSPF